MLLVGFMSESSLKKSLLNLYNWVNSCEVCGFCLDTELTIKRRCHLGAPRSTTHRSNSHQDPKESSEPVCSLTHTCWPEGGSTCHLNKVHLLAGNLHTFKGTWSEPWDEQWPNLTDLMGMTSGLRKHHHTLQQHTKTLDWELQLWKTTILPSLTDSRYENDMTLWLFWKSRASDSPLRVNHIGLFLCVNTGRKWRWATSEIPKSEAKTSGMPPGGWLWNSS